jgi:hypothetical protein
MPNKPRTDHPNYHHGPPPVKYDLRIIEDMASFGCTYKEIAIICGFGETRFRALRHEHPDIQEAIDLGRARLCQKLRKKQIELALDGNDKMLIFLGKALLEQTDRVEINQTVKAEIEYEVNFGDTTHQDNPTEAASETDDGSE